MSLNPKNKYAHNTNDASVHSEHRYWMLRALRLASRSLGVCSTNPGVAACIVRDGVLLGEGRHEICGQDHGEIAALTDCVQRGNNAHGADIYVTLAPCTSQGRTPACSAAIIQAGLSRVFAAIADPIQDSARSLFAAAGIAYETGLMSELAAHIHGGFLHRCTHGRPRISGKWAMSLDGHIACNSGHSAWLSSPQALAMSRRRRRVFDAIVIGSGTLLADDPQLLASGGSGASGKQSPQRIIIAGQQMPDFTGKRILNRSSEISVHCLHRSSDQAAIDRASDLGVHCQHVSQEGTLDEHISYFTEQGFNEVLVEGGSRMHAAFLRQQYYDRLEIYTCARSLGGGISAADGPGCDRVELGDQWQLEQSPMVLGDSVCLRYQRQS